MENFDKELLLNELEKNNIVEKSNNGYRISRNYKNIYNEQKDIGSNLNIKEKFDEHVEKVEFNSAENKNKVFNNLKALYDIDNNLPEDKYFIISYALMMIENSSPKSSIINISGSNLQEFLNLNSKAIIFVTKNCCEPCKKVRDRIEKLVANENVPEDVMLAEISGPNNKKVLYKEFDVVGAPTILFCEEGRIEMRLLGNSSIEQIKQAVADIY